MPKKFGPRARGEHEVVGRQRPAVVEHERAVRERRRRDAPEDHVDARHVREDRAQRARDVLGGQLRRGHLVEQRLELVVVGAVDQRRADARLAEGLRRGDARQAAAEHQHVGHSDISSMRSARMIRAGGLDEGEVRERLREVAQVPRGDHLELLGVQAERGRDPQQPFHAGRAPAASRRRS